MSLSKTTLREVFSRCRARCYFFEIAASKPRGTVAGQVTFSGTPVTGALISFENPDLGVDVLATVGAEGRFAVLSPGNNGLPPGQYRVAVKPGQLMKPGEISFLMESRPPATASVTIPQRYHSPATSELVIDVAEGKNPELAIDLMP